MKLRVKKGELDSYWLSLKLNNGLSGVVKIETRGKVIDKLLDEASKFDDTILDKPIIPELESILNEIEEVIHVSKMGGSSHTLVSRLTTIVNNHRSNKSVGD